MKKKRIIILAVLAVFTAAFLVYSHFENTVIEVTGYVLKSEKLPSGFDGFKIVQVSDLHSASFGKGNGELGVKILNDEATTLTCSANAGYFIFSFGF